MDVLGNRIRTAYDDETGREADVVGNVTRSPSGNLILVIGQEHREDGTVSGWHKTAHVVLDAEEERELVARIAVGAANPTNDPHYFTHKD